MSEAIKDIQAQVPKEQQQNSPAIDNGLNKGSFLGSIANSLFEFVKSIVRFVSVVVVKITLGKEASEDLRKRMMPAKPVIKEKVVTKDQPAIKITQPIKFPDQQVVNNRFEKYINDMVEPIVDIKTAFKVTENIDQDTNINTITISINNGTQLTIDKNKNSPIDYTLCEENKIDIIKIMYCAYQSYLNEQETKFTMSAIDKQNIQSEIKNWIENSTEKDLSFNVGGAIVKMARDDTGFAANAYVIDTRNNGDNLEKTHQIKTINFNKEEINGPEIFNMLDIISEESIKYYAESFNEMTCVIDENIVENYETVLDNLAEEKKIEQYNEEYNEPSEIESLYDMDIKSGKNHIEELEKTKEDNFTHDFNIDDTPLIEEFPLELMNADDIELCDKYSNDEDIGIEL